MYESEGSMTYLTNFISVVVVVDFTTLKMAWKPVKIQRKVQQGALGKVNIIN